MTLLVIGRFGELRHPDVPGVQRGDEPLDGTPFAGCVPSLEHDTDRGAEGAVTQQAFVGKAQVKEPVLGGTEAPELGALGESEGQIHLVQVGHGPY